MINVSDVKHLLREQHPAVKEKLREKMINLIKSNSSRGLQLRVQ